MAFFKENNKVSKISKLAESIIKSDKMTTSEVIEYIGNLMEQGYSTDESYRMLYEKAYDKVLTKEVADEWVKSMSIPDMSDRSTGMKWSCEQTTDVGNKINVNWKDIDKVEWYIVMNMMYSDFYQVFKTIERQDDAILYGRMAKAWLYDDDVENCHDKLFNYYFYVVK